MTTSAATAYEILPNGKKRYTRATVVDIVVSMLLPFWGFGIGGLALAKGEKNRGKVMMLIGGAELLVLVLLRIL